MKKYILLIILPLLFFSCSSNDKVEIGQKTSMKVNPVFNAGKVLLGEEIMAEFAVENTGDYPLIISDVSVSCSCTLAEKPEEPIQPGESGVIKATVSTVKTGVGAVAKELRVIANTEPSLTKLKINATVYRK